MKVEFLKSMMNRTMKYFVVCLFFGMSIPEASAVDVSCTGETSWSSGGQSGLAVREHAGSLYRNNSSNGHDGAGDNPAVNGDWTLIGTCADVPSVTSDAVTAMTSITATLNGTVNNNNGFALTDRGFIYGTSSANVSASTIGALVGSAVSVSEGGTSVAAYNKAITALCPGETIYVKAYATNSEGTGYSIVIEDETPTTPGIFTTVQDGDWTDAATWGGCSPPSTLLGHDIRIGHVVGSVSKTLTNGTKITVTTGGDYTVTGSLTMGSDNTVTVDVGGTLQTTLDFLANNSPSTVTINGTLDVGRNYDITTSGVTHNLNGQIDVAGWMEVSANTSVTVGGGQVAIVGALKLNTNGIVTGATGTITYGSYVIGSCGFSFIICNGTNKGDGCAAVNPPANGLDFATCLVPCPVATVAGTVTASATVCSGTNGPTTLTLAGHTGTINKWQQNEDGAGWTDMAANATINQDYEDITVTTQYRAVLQNGTGCDVENSVASTITVDPVSVGGSINNTATVCSGDNGATLTLSGHVGTITEWEKSENGGAWTSIGNGATTTYIYSDITVTTAYRAVLTSGVCAAANSATSTITVDAVSVGGTITAAASVCFEDPATTTLTLADHTGLITKWQSSIDNWITPVDIANATTTQDYTSLSATTKYRAVLTNGVCAAANSADVTITVYADLTAGTMGTAQSIAIGATPSTLTATVASVGGVAAYTYQWESSTNSGGAWANAGGTDDEATYSPGALTVTTWYRRTITSGSACGSEISNTVIITVNKYVCSGSAPSNVSSGGGASGGSGGGPTYQWEISTNGSAYVDVAGETGVAYTGVASVTVNSWYRRKVTIDGCVAYSNVLNAVISAGSPGGIASGLVVWLRADAGVGSIGTQWDDQSGNGYHYTEAGAGAPTVSAGDSSSNYNAFVELPANSGFNAHASAALGADHTIFVVARKTSTDNDGRILDGQVSSSYAWGHDGTYGGSLINSTSPAAGAVSPATTASAEVKMLQTFKRTSAGAYTHRIDGAASATYASADDPTGELVDINAGASGNTSTCRVFEVVIYNSALSTSDIEIVESYLMTKYGLGQTNNAYKTSTGGSTYDVASYNNDIIGIGKECYFNQKQSGSADDSIRVWVSDGGSTGWKATNALNAGTIANDASYVMMGHNGGLLKATEAANAEKPAGVDNRLEREWKITNTNFDDNFTIELEWDSTGSFALADVRFLVDDDGDFSNATVYSTGDNGMTFALGSIVIEDVSVGVIAKGATKFVTIGAVGATALPVELLMFQARQQDDHNLISWVTASEINSSHFEVEKSADGINWEVLEIVQSAGNSVEIINYSTIDNELCVRKCYYRLNQVDIDGSNVYSDIEVIESSNESMTKLNIYPVPVTGEATVQFTTANTSMYTVEIFSAIGSSVFEAKVVCVEGENAFDINTSSYAKGMYHLIMRDTSGDIVNKKSFTK